MPSATPRSPQGADHPVTRTIVDGPGRRWRIREVDTRAQPGARGPRCLVCEGEAVVRRVWDYPADWFERPDAELAALCAGRAPAPGP